MFWTALVVVDSAAACGGAGKEGGGGEKGTRKALRVVSVLLPMVAHGG
jgi:hypothetical protein